MRYLDVCAGISASSVAWKPLGWEAAAYSEIEPAPRAILEHRQGALPVGWDHRHAAGSNTTPLFGDFTQIEAHHVGPIDLLVGGTPCQDFSVAGLRAGLDGDRGNLTLEYVRLADRLRPRWLAWENVPGILSIDGGRAFGAFLRGLAECGYGFAYRVLDAQHFGVPQRRRRVILVGYLGDWRRAAAVLFERHSMSGYPAPRRDLRKDGPGSSEPLALNISDGRPRLDGVSATLNTAMTRGSSQNTYVAYQTFGDGAVYETGDITAPLRTGTDSSAAIIAFVHNSRDEVRVFGGDGQTVGAIPAQPGAKQQSYCATRTGVRKFTPRECERLQGFPDDYTLVTYRGKPMADGPRYKAIGNSMHTGMMRWIGERIVRVDALEADQRDAA